MNKIFLLLILHSNIIFRWIFLSFFIHWFRLGICRITFTLMKHDTGTFAWEDIFIVINFSSVKRLTGADFTFHTFPFEYKQPNIKYSRKYRSTPIIYDGFRHLQYERKDFFFVKIQNCITFCFILNKQNTVPYLLQFFLRRTEFSSNLKELSNKRNIYM